MDQTQATEFQRIIDGFEVEDPVSVLHTVRAAQANRDWIVPEFVRYFREAVEQSRDSDVPPWRPVTAVVILLLEFRATEMLPSLLDACTLSSNDLFDLLGDAIFEVLPRAIAVLADDPLAVVDQIARNDAVEPVIRWSALDAYRFLLRDGRTTRDEASDRLHGLLREYLAAPQPNSELLTGLAALFADIPCPAARNDLERAYAAGLIGAMLAPKEDVLRPDREAEQHYQEAVAELAPTLKGDPASTILEWLMFDEASIPAVLLNDAYNPDLIVEALDEGFARLPVEAIRAAQRNRESIVPRLVEVIRQTTASARAGQVPGGSKAFFAAYLLMEFDAKEALPAILESFALPENAIEEIYGDAVEDVLPRAIAALADDPLLVLDRFMGDPSVSERARRSAALGYLYVARDLRTSRDAAAERLRRVLWSAAEAGNRDLAEALVSELRDFGMSWFESDVRDLVGRDLLSQYVLRETEYETSLDQVFLESIEDLPPTRPEDTVAELEDWDGFSEQEEDYGEFDEDEPWDEDADDEDVAFYRQEFDRQLRMLRGEPVEPNPWVANRVDQLSEPPPPEPSYETEPLRSAKPAVGRNDPCPCGSGKKYKKCCGKKS